MDIQDLRQERGITLRQVQKATGISNAVICQLEHGCTPRLDTALRLAAFLEMPVEKIWGLKGK